MEDRKMNVVSACFEAMLDQKFHIYAGGLGVVQAGLLKSAGRKNWPVNLYGLGILWKEGYYDQRVNLFDPARHYMKIKYVPRRYDFLEDTGIKVKVEIDGYINFIKVWYLRPEIFNTAPSYLLDTDLEENDELARAITRHLYGGNEKTRLAQEIVLGIGGVRAFEALGIPVDLWHGQEGHTLLLAIELLRKNLEAHSDLLSSLNKNKNLSDGAKTSIRQKIFKEALNTTREQYVFTTHTPEPAGNETHPIDLMMGMGCFPGIPRELVRSIGEDPFYGDCFNMTLAALKLARKANAVSKLHLATTQRMWAWIKEEERCPIISITNGVDADWQFPEFVRAASIQEIQLAKEKYKEQLIKYIEKRTSKVFQMGIPILVWARRFTDYKRPWLISKDWPWLKKLLQDGKFQLVIAGKPHPNDSSSNFFNWIYEKSLEVPNLAVLAGYERSQSEILKAGADIWLQTARRPREACGTSWISAILNCALVISSKDGGILEIPDDYYLPFGVDSPGIREDEQDAKDHRALVKIIEFAVEYYEDRASWYQKVLLAKKFVEENFLSDRMLGEYVESMYLS